MKHSDLPRSRRNPGQGWSYASQILGGNLRGPLSKIHPSVFGRKNKFSSHFVYELDFGQY